jgi:hypothetical protein
MGLSFKRRTEDSHEKTIKKGGSDFFVSLLEREPHGPEDVSSPLCNRIYETVC